MLPAIILIAAVLGSVAAAVGIAQWRDAKAMRARRDRLRSRPIADIDTWYREHFAPRGIHRSVAITVATSLAKALGCDPTQLRPDDSFVSDLALRGVSWFQVDPDDELTYFGEVSVPELVGRRLSESETANLATSRTVADLVAAIGRCRTEGHGDVAIS